MIAETQAEYQSDAGSTKETPYLCLTGELWGVFVNIFEKIDRILTAPHCCQYYVCWFPANGYCGPIWGGLICSCQAWLAARWKDIVFVYWMLIVNSLIYNRSPMIPAWLSTLWRIKTNMAVNHTGFYFEMHFIKWEILSFTEVCFSGPSWQQIIDVGNSLT